MIYIHACAEPSRRSTLFISCAMEMCYSELSSCLYVVSGRVVILVCLSLSVDRAVEPVERVMCLNVTIANSSRHGRDAKHDPSLVL